MLRGPESCWRLARVNYVEEHIGETFTVCCLARGTTSPFATTRPVR